MHMKVKVHINNRHSMHFLNNATGCNMQFLFTARQFGAHRDYHVS